MNETSVVSSEAKAEHCNPNPPTATEMLLNTKGAEEDVEVRRRRRGLILFLFLSLIISKLIYKVVCVSPPTWILRSVGHQEAVC